MDVDLDRGSYRLGDGSEFGVTRNWMVGCYVREPGFVGDKCYLIHVRAVSALEAVDVAYLIVEADLGDKPQRFRAYAYVA